MTEDDFDGIYARIQAAGIEHWADPQGKLPQQYNTTAVSRSYKRSGISRGLTAKWNLFQLRWPR